MSQEWAKFYLVDLQDGQKRSFDHMVDPEFLDINEADVRFREPFRVAGCVYQTDGMLLVEFSAEPRVELRCRVCNEWAPTPLKVVRAVLAVEMEELDQASGMVNLCPWIREAIVVEIPSYGECEGGCSLREQLGHYFHNTDAPSGHQPFANL